MGHLHPPLDFLIYGLDRSWMGPRWLEFVEGSPTKPVWGAWLAHGLVRMPPPSEPFVLVGTFPLQRWIEHGARDETDPVRSLAWAAMFALVNRATPRVGKGDDGRYWRRTLALADARADETSQWKQLTWPVDRESVKAHVTTWAGAWGVFISDLPAVGVVVIGSGITPEGLALNRVTDSALLYHFDAAEPIIFPGTLVSSSSAALGDAAGPQQTPWPLHDGLLGQD